MATAIPTAYLRGACAAQSDIAHDNWIGGEFARNPERGADREEWQQGYDSVMKPFLKTKKQAA